MKKYLNIYNVFLVFLIVLNTLPILAPILLHLGFENSSGIIYDIYSFFCHQQHWKSLHVHDNQFAWCTRDVFIWSSLLVAAIYVKKTNIKSIGWKMFIPYVIPIAIDGGSQTLASIFGYSSNEVAYVSTNLLRMITGTIFGTGLGLFILPILKEISDNKPGLKDFSITAQLRYLGVILIGMFFVYIFLVRLWLVTSDNYLPTNFLDSETKLPESNQQWFERRKDGNSFVKRQVYNW